MYCLYLLCPGSSTLARYPVESRSWYGQNRGLMGSRSIVRVRALPKYLIRLVSYGESRSAQDGAPNENLLFYVSRLIWDQSYNSTLVRGKSSVHTTQHYRRRTLLLHEMLDFRPVVSRFIACLKFAAFPAYLLGIQRRVLIVCDDSAPLSWSRYSGRVRHKEHIRIQRPSGLVDNLHTC